MVSQDRLITVLSNRDRKASHGAAGDSGLGGASPSGRGRDSTRVGERMGSHHPQLHRPCLEAGLQSFETDYWLGELRRRGNHAVIGGDRCLRGGASIKDPCL